MIKTRFFAILLIIVLSSHACLCFENDPLPEGNGLFSKIKNTMSWLVKPAKWISSDNSDKHDLHLTSQVTSKFESPTGNKETVAVNNNLYHKIVNGFWKYAKYLRYPAAYSNINFMSTIVDTLIQAGQCLTSGEFYDPDLGYFKMDKSLYCNNSCHRLIPGIMCCNPQTPEMLDVKFRLWIKGKPERILNWRDPNDRQYLTPNSRVVYIIHGYFEKLSTTAWMVRVRDAYLDLGNDVIVIDHRRASAIHYWQALANGRVVGAMIGKSVMNWGIHDRTLLVGFSLGGQIVGEAGLYTQVNGNVTIDECHGLDPAGPFYDGCHKDIRLDKSDCRLVQVCCCFNTTAFSKSNCLPSGYSYFSSKSQVSHLRYRSSRNMV